MAPLKLKDLMAEVGFENVVEQRVPIPINTWPKGRESKIIGAMEQMNLLDLADGMTKSIFIKVLGWSVEEVEVFLVSVRESLKNTGIHAYIPWFVLHSTVTTISARSTDKRIVSAYMPKSLWKRFHDIQWL